MLIYIYIHIYIHTYIYIWDTSARMDIFVTFSSTLSPNYTPLTKRLIQIKMFPGLTLKSRVIIFN